MIYATWKLNFDNPDYGTGPEDEIQKLGESAQGGLPIGSITEDGLILGYVSDSVDETKLAKWNYSELSEEEALSLAQSVLPDAEVLDGGYIGVSEE